MPVYFSLERAAAPFFGIKVLCHASLFLKGNLLYASSVTYLHMLVNCREVFYIPNSCSLLIISAMWQFTGFFVF